MRSTLCEISEMPGPSLPFSCQLETTRLADPSTAEFVSPPQAEGKISNTAGALTLTGKIVSRMVCLCDRCGAEFNHTMVLPLNVKLAADLEDEENPDIFPLDGNFLDLDDVLETCFILNTDAKFLCNEDCAGLCSRCGKNLNEGSCTCGKEIDPRLAVLQQLLDKQEEKADNQLN